MIRYAKKDGEKWFAVLWTNKYFTIPLLHEPLSMYTKMTILEKPEAQKVNWSNIIIWLAWKYNEIRLRFVSASFNDAFTKFRNTNYL